MSSKAKADTKVLVLKGQEEAEIKVLEYLKRVMNRPYGAVDVAANLKGAIPKAAVQKILVALAEKGQLVQKTYGKTAFFVVNQSTIDTIPSDSLTILEAEQKAIDEENKILAIDLRTSMSELTKLRTAPSDEQLALEIVETSKSVALLTARLQPLRSGAPLISAAELSQVDSDWMKWRAEWVKRRKVFTTFWQLATDTLPPQDAASLAEDLGIEVDTSEHAALERTSLCLCPRSTNPLKRKR